MKIPTLAVAAATAATVVAAQPHAHQHKHQHPHPVKKDVTETYWAAAATQTVYELGNHEISVGQVCEGLGDGELKMMNGESAPAVCSVSSTTSTWTTTSSELSTTTATTTSTTTSDWATTTSSAAGEFFQAPSEAPSWTSSAPAAASSSWNPSSGGSGVTAVFPDGQLSCSTFPSDYGAVYIDYLGLSGWTGTQNPGSSIGGLNNIVTGISGTGCSEGMYCSYACPPGYQKTQWPSTQGATGQSVGGLLCQGGKLHLTNSGLSSSLCMAGVGGVSAQNNAGSVVSICRTDYPGTESETIPTVLEAGENQPLTVPDAASYYVWQGKSTSAQYYLNPPGYGASDACQWGSPGKPLGNYAPINFGVGAKGGTTWLSIMANTPTTTATYPGTVEIQGNISGTCKYENGQFWSNGVANSAGCTVSLSSGSATYVIS